MESLKVARPNGWMAKKVGRGVPAAGHAIHERESELSDALTYTQARRDLWLIRLCMGQTSFGTLSPIPSAVYVKHPVWAKPPARRRRAPRRLRGPPSKASAYSRPPRLSKRHSVYIVLG